MMETWKDKNLTIEERRKAFLDETIEFFRENERAVDMSGQCYYNSVGNSKGCAIGRLIEDKNICKELDCAILEDGNGIYQNYIFDKVILEVPELKDLGQWFLEEIQNLHDNGMLWLNKGLSYKGRCVVERIIKEFCTKEK